MLLLCIREIICVFQLLFCIETQNSSLEHFILEYCKITRSRRLVCGRTNVIFLIL